MKKLFALFTICIILIPGAALAAAGDTCSPTYSGSELCNAIGFKIGGQTVKDIPTFIQAAFTWLAGIVTTLVMIILIFSGARMIVAQGNQEAINQAKASFTYAIYGFLVILFAYVIISTVQFIVGYNDEDPMATRSQFFNPLRETDLPNFVNTTIIDFLGFLGVMAVLFIVWNGFRYVTAGGNEEQVKSARQGVTWAVIGVISILLSYTIIQVLVSTLRPYS